MNKDVVIFTIAQGDSYENMASNLFHSIKKLNDITTLCVSKNTPKYCDIHIELNCDINNFGIEKQPYSFKLGILTEIKNYIKKFKKIIYIDADSECVDVMHLDPEIEEIDFYSAWCQPIVTQKKEQQKINQNWIWRGGSFEKHFLFAKEHQIKEWKNVNGGLIILNYEKIEEINKNFKKWTKKCKNFYNKNEFGDEFIMSLMQAEWYPEYSTPNICKNRICQLNMEESVTTIRTKKEFLYNPWFNTSGSSLVKATCVHSPKSKKLLIEQGSKL